MKGPKDRPQDRPKGAFGQEYPQHVSSEASSPAVLGPLKVCYSSTLQCSDKVTQHDMPCTDLCGNSQHGMTANYHWSRACIARMLSCKLWAIDSTLKFTLHICCKPSTSANRAFLSSMNGQLCLAKTSGYPGKYALQAELSGCGGKLPIRAGPLAKSSGFAAQVQPEGGQRNEERIDVDGLPHVGAVIYPGQAYYSKVDCATGVL